MPTLNELKPVVEFIGAMLSPIMAGSMIYIAVQQWKINREKSDREIHSIQIEIYLKVRLLLDYIDMHRECDPALYQDFTRALAEADFVFDDEFVSWLRDIDLEVHCINEYAIQIAQMLSHRDGIQGSSGQEYEWVSAAIEKESEHIERSMHVIWDAQKVLLDKFKYNMRKL